MKFRNFTGQIPNFFGGFSGATATESSGTIWVPSTYKSRGSFQTTASGETSPTGLWFKPDGTKLFVIGSTQDRIKSWDLTVPWDINTTTNLYNMTTTLFDNVGVALTQPTGITFSNDGLYAFVVDFTNSALYRYNLSVAWDLSTLNTTASQVNTTIYAANLNPGSIWLRPDGLMFLTANSGVTTQHRTWTTAVANDITTLTAGTTTAATNTPVGSFFADDGNRWCFVNQANDAIGMSPQLPTPYSITSVPAGTQSYIVTSFDTTPQDIYVKNDGSAYYYLGSASDTIYQFTLN